MKMHAKERKVLVTFPSATAAMAMETAARLQKLPGRLVPVPGFISAGCGMAWMAPAHRQQELESFFAANAVPYEKMVQLYL